MVTLSPQNALAFFAVKQHLWYDDLTRHIASTDTRTCVDYLGSRFLVLTNAINHFCCLIHSNTACDYKATFCKTECQN
jgi:hypothetical protein